MQRNQLLFLFASILAISFGCSKESVSTQKNDEPIEVGGLYASQEDDGSWSVSKVLAVDDSAVHLRIYANKFSEQPKDIDPATLTIGGINDPAGFGIGHAPVAKEGFINGKPILIKVVPVEESELDGYKLYLDSQ